jgi:hypothetical protein
MDFSKKFGKIDFNARRNQVAHLSGHAQTGGARLSAAIRDRRRAYIHTYIYIGGTHMGGPANRVQKNELMTLDQIATAARLRASGWTVPKISGEMKLPAGRVRELLAEALEIARSDASYNADALRRTITDRLEYAIECLAPEVAAGKAYAVEKWVMCFDRLAKLHGLDAPVTSIREVNINRTAAPETGAVRALDLIKRGLDRLANQLPPEDSQVVEAASVRQLDE